MNFQIVLILNTGSTISSTAYSRENEGIAIITRTRAGRTVQITSRTDACRRRWVFPFELFSEEKWKRHEAII